MSPRRSPGSARFSKIDEAILKAADLEPTLDVIVAQAQRVLEVDAADVFLYDPVTSNLRYGAGAGFRTHLPRGTPLALGSGLAGQAALHSEPLGVPDLSTSALPDVPKELVEQEGFVSYYAVPLISKGELQGVLGAHHRSPLAMEEAWCDMAADLGRQAAIAIDHAQLFADLQRSRDELQLSYDRTIEGWARALDLKDEETAGHSQRVTKLTVDLAWKLGFSGEALADVRRGALLHDIGKMGIPDAILLKPGKLDAEEWEIIKRHPVHARDFLAGVPFLERALDIPYAHHERWDGSGYPRGLLGEDIPLPARIFAVADVYDALTSDRPYRAAWSRAQAYEHIEREAGAHFDPRIVAAFLELLDEQPSTAD
ncbi:MAG: HD domain-containing phosphohydrolase [Trueperaceae bacterium]|nr:HD domain-containing phosphohydrolase [Trueperaceae bacterium]